MLSASSMAELEAMLKKEIQKAMNVVSAKADKDMDEATDYFYSGGYPDMYERTGKLGETPRVTSLKSIANGYEFEVSLDQSGGYTSGSAPSMEDVLKLANYGIPFETKNRYKAKPNVGNMLFWEYGLEKIEDDLKSTMSKFFN